MAAGVVALLSLVSVRRLWRDLQAFCCSQGKCNFHDNSNLNCTLKVRGPEPPSTCPAPTRWLWMGPRSLGHPAESQTRLAAHCRWGR